MFYSSNTNKMKVIEKVSFLKNEKISSLVYILLQNGVVSGSLIFVHLSLCVTICVNFLRLFRVSSLSAIISIKSSACLAYVSASKRVRSMASLKENSRVFDDDSRVVKGPEPFLNFSSDSIWKWLNHDSWIIIWRKRSMSW